MFFLKRALFLIVFWSVCSSSLTIPQAQERKMRFEGKKILLHYENGLEIRGDYRTANELQWEALSGPAKGEKGIEKIQSVEIAPDIYFINWLEKSGITVSQVLDFSKSTVSAFITYNSGSSRKSTLEKGTFAEIKQ
jgi:hypothetical protein